MAKYVRYFVAYTLRIQNKLSIFLRGRETRDGFLDEVDQEPDHESKNWKKFVEPGKERVQVSKGIEVGTRDMV